jgi:hypothetical protein
MNIVECLESQLNLLDQSLEASPEDTTILKSIEIIMSIFYFLNYKRSGKTSDQILSLKECDQCGTCIDDTSNKQSIILSCSHKVCSPNCLQKLTRISSPSLLDLENTKCLECSSIINESFIILAFGGSRSFSSLLSEPKIPINSTFNCSLCLQDIKIEEELKLDCGHTFCKTSIKEYIEQLVLDHKVLKNEIVCPQCNVEINEVIIKYLIEKKIYKKFKRVLLKKILKNFESPLFFMLQPMKDTDELEIANLEYFGECGGCLRDDCSTCLEFRSIELKNKQRVIEEDERILEESMKALGFKRCPHCKSMCEKISGCKFMRCYSPLCKGKNAFCYLCVLPLDESQHYSHYKSQGPFGEICNTLEKTLKKPTKS